MKTTKLVGQFEEGTLKREDWSHANHLKIALWYICKYDNMWMAVSIFRVGNILRRIHASTVYEVAIDHHETITVFWFEQVYDFYLRHKELECDFENMWQNFLEEAKVKFCKGFINQFYTEEILQSDEARARYIPHQQL